MEIRQITKGTVVNVRLDELAQAPAAVAEKQKARRELLRAGRRGFRYCEASFFNGSFRGLLEKAHPANDRLNWGIGQDITRRYFFVLGHLIRDPFYKFTNHYRDHSRTIKEACWKASGMDCMVVKDREMGHRCGYVRVPLTHPWYSLDYSACLHQPVCPEKYCDHRLDMQIDVHGGLTYSGRWNGLFGGWWFGFDCSHCDDGLAPEYIAEQRAMFGDDFMKHHNGLHYWTKEEVMVEVERLAAQIKEVKK